MIKKYQLKNGLTVLLVENHKSPVVSVQMWVRNGSADEAKGEEGISHFIEHLVFKGTRSFGVGEIAAQIEGAGGELNAYTSFDQTVFYVTLSKNFLDLGLLTIAEMMGFPKFDKAEVDAEREVVVEEIKRGMDSLGRRASQQMFSAGYKKHPYGRPVIGYEKNVRKWSVAKIRKYFEQRYSTKNMFLVVSGDFQENDVKQKIQKVYSDIPAHAVKRIKRAKELTQKQPRITVENSEFNQSIGYLCWKIPKITHKDIPALDVLSLIVGQGESSHLVQSMRIKEALVNSIGTSLFAAQDEGLFVLSFGYNKENLPRILEALLQNLKNVVHLQATPQELDKAITNFECDQFYSLETVDGMSRFFGNSEFVMKDPKASEKYLKLIQKITLKDLAKAAKKYVNASTITASIMTNDDVKSVQPLIKKFVKDFQDICKLKEAKVAGKGAIHSNIKNTVEKTSAKTAAKSKNAKPKFDFKISSKPAVSKKSGSSDLGVEKVVLKNGATLFLKHSEETHTVSMKAAFLGGVRAESADLPGSVELMTRTWMGGTKKHSEQDIGLELDSIAGGVSPMSGRNTIGLGGECLAPFQDRMAEIYFDSLVSALLPSEVSEREKLVQLEQIKSKKDNPSQLCIRHFMKMMFGEHPYSRDMLGTEESLRKIDRAALEQIYKSTVTSSNATFMLAGRFDRSLWMEKIEQAVQAMPTGKKLEKSIPIEPLKKNNFSFEELKKEQSHLVVGYRGLKLNDKKRFTLQLMESILSGMGGRLFSELREKHSLAYTVSPVRLDGLDGGYFGAYIGCSPEKSKKAYDLMKVEFNKLCNELVSEDELMRAKRYLIGRHDIDLQKISSIASAILYNEIYGIDHREVFRVVELYSPITAQDIRDLAKEIFQSHEIISLVGPSNPF